jgi:hypothetical protein
MYVLLNISHKNTDNTGELIQNQQHNMEGIGLIRELGLAIIGSTFKHPWMRSGSRDPIFQEEVLEISENNLFSQ